jgi:hypothetical protein
MATRTLAAAQAELAIAYAARTKVMQTGQSVAVDGQAVTLAHLGALNDTIALLEREVESLTVQDAGSYSPFRYTLASFT